MAGKKQEKLGFQYIEIPKGSYAFFLSGENHRGTGAKDPWSLHFHNYLEIGFCREGEGVIVFNGRELSCSSGAFFVVPPNYPHRLAGARQELAVSGFDFLYVDVSGFLRDYCQDRPKFAHDLATLVYQRACLLHGEANPQLWEVIQEILRELRCQEAFFREKLCGLLLSLLVEIARLCPEEPKGEDASVTQAKISNALRYVCEHYQEPIRIQTLAQQCCLSETHFRRVFQSVMNMSPNEYVNFFRIYIACRLMESTDFSLEEIAARTGFVSTVTFHRNFRKFMDMAPNQWRHQESFDCAVRDDDSFSVG